MLSLELVPRSIEGVLAEAQSCLGLMNIDRINIPDIRRLEHRSHDVVGRLLELGINAVPHLRTQDRSLSDTLVIVEALLAKGLREILLVSGDPGFGEASGLTPLVLIAELKRRFPSLVVYGGFDPYRGSLKSELDYAQAKLEAGADGLFSQPFFDENLLRFWMSMFAPGLLWAGLSPVHSQKTREYWERVNHVPFAGDMDYSLEACARQSASLCRLAESLGQHVYFMPIRMDSAEYLKAVHSHI